MSTDAFLDAAKALFLESGYDGVTLDAVAKRAGCARQTVYNRFGSKEALFRATLERHWGFFGAAAAAGDPRVDVSAGDAALVLRGVAEIILEFLAASDQIAFTRLVIAESRRWAWIGEEFYRLGKRPALEQFIAKIEELVAAGQLECPDPDLAARQFLGLIQEFAIWPHVMAIGQHAMSELPPTAVVVDEAVAMFVSRYGSATSPRGRR